jgi:hypothetical protein
MLPTYALILLLNLTDEEQLLAGNQDLSDPIQDTLELKLTETELEGRMVFDEDESC